MKAVRLHAAGDLRVEDIPAPGTPAPGWVRLTVTAAGICGSDLHNFRTGQWITRAPSVAGHELTGIVAELGKGVEGLSVGQSVVADSRFWCGTCPACLGQRHHLCEKLGFVGEACDGGFAEEVNLPARLLLPVDPAIDPAVAAMAEPLAVALHTLRRLALQPGEPVLVLGCGTIGGLCALLIARQHDGPLLVADRNAARAQRVAEVTGATIVPLEAEAIRAALKGGLPMAAIEATGSTAALGHLIGCVEGGGRIGLVGIFHGRLDIDPNLLVEREVSLIGCHAFTDELPTALTALTVHHTALTGLVDQQVELDAAPAAYARLLAGEATGLKTILRPQGVS
ncbi:zinc-dependent alcohol dehydrogenase [Ancylobacter sp. SL191]|uniref:zinc-dependent alcohol dehydrogenase n=1 Tax=Ancylobacter sp. SL191 TaxID=2995166 RepID=UPI002270EF39|nr:alcohol dehydrogenase catalytic domain-containing protein [Ancylobacter sp. SL191]WAC28647.1 alcohol dehydrogenase catalytic domain-containing protein [Ancylobacter sp. SL191]